MQKVIYRNEIDKYRNEIDGAVINYINEGLTETFENFEKFSLIAFDWIDLADFNGEPAQILVYMDTEDLFFLCENETAYKAAAKHFTEAVSNERALYMFFKNLLKGDWKNLERIEDRISELDDAVMKSSSEELREKIVDIRYDLLRLKKYYEQFESIFEELCDEENEVIGEEYISYYENIANRVDKLLTETGLLREYITQVRESYQAQIDIEQNRLMKVFTLVTSIFLPLTLIAGWYGMNFINMPELTSPYGYIGVIVVSLVVVVIWFIIFKKKGWFKG